MNKLTMPDFVERSKDITDREDVSIALEQVFKQGYSLGYADGVENGWVNEWEEFFASLEKE